MTYIMIPKNHPEYQFPYNLEDRVDYIEKELTTKLKTEIDFTVDNDKGKKYTIKFKNDPKLMDESIIKNIKVFKRIVTI